MASSPTSLYVQVIRITRIYLGPAADRFISRQVQNHLQKKPEDLSKADLEKLIDWIKVAMSLITEDGELVQEYSEHLMRLGNKSLSSKSKELVDGTH